MECRFCCQRSDFIDAHVIPAGFFKRLRDGPDPARLLSSSVDDHPKRAPIGVYDQRILCVGCEPRFGPWDQYAQKVLSEPFSGQALKCGHQVVGYELRDGWHYELLKLFFISLAWRASVSTHSFYKRIRLGPFEQVAKTMLDEGRPGEPQEFSVVIGRFTDPVRSRLVLDPHVDRLEGVNHIRVYLGGYVAYIKADKRSAPKWMSTFMLTPDEPLKIIGRDITQSRELRVVQNILEQSLNRTRGRDADRSTIR